MNQKLLILAVVGMPASGKSEVINILKKDFNFFHIYYGDITFEEIKKRGLEITEANEKLVREGLRATGDMGIYSKMLLPKIQEAISSGHNFILLESMYNIYEYEIIKEKYKDNFKVLAIHSDFDKRVERISSRKERVLTKEELEQRQISEAKNLNKGSVIAIADYHYLNNGDSMEVFKSDIAKLISRILVSDFK